jgi:hypothetical protein
MLTMQGNIREDVQYINLTDKKAVCYRIIMYLSFNNRKCVRCNKHSV